MNLQENIHRIKEVMGVINESWQNSLKRRIHNIDDLIPLIIREVIDRENICKYSIDKYVDAVVYHTIEHMYWDFFKDIDDGSEEWIQMYDTMEKYIQDKFGQELRVDWQVNCLMKKRN